MSQRRLYRGLVVVCALAALWAIVLWLSDGIALQLGPLRISSESPRNPLLLALASGMAAWMLAMGGAATPAQPAGRPRRARFVLLAGLLTLGLNVLMMAQPTIPPDRNYCMADHEIGKGFHYIVNCDSLPFLWLAKDPTLVLTIDIRQSRPLSFVLPYLVAQPLSLVPGLARAGPYPPYSREFAAYVLINLSLLVLAAVSFATLVNAAAPAAPGPELLFTLVVLVVNDVTKIYFWTPHVQVYNLVIPCLTMLLLFRLIERGEPLRAGQAAWLGLALGTAVLAYGAFLIPVLSAVLLQLFWYRRVVAALVLGAASVLPAASWAAFIQALTGSFYSHEIGAYRQFVWIGDCAALGLDACVPVMTGHLKTFFDTAAPIVVVPLVLLFVCHLVRWIRPPSVPVADPRTPALGLAVATTFCVTAVFLALMGFYSPRLNWLMMPPLLLALALELKALRVSRAWTFLSPIAFAASLIYVLALLTRQGPYN